VYQPAAHLLWDAWFAFDGTAWHAYYLQAPRDLDDPEQRHDLAEVGHAVSTDLRHWTEQAVAFRAGAPGTWEDRSIYTGSVLVHDGRAHFFYTSTSRAERGLVQRIGHAVSADFHVFERSGDGPILEVDPTWYESDGGPYDEVHWRDPWALRHEDRWHLFITARAATGAWDGRGTVALASSVDLRDWSVHPPVVETGDFWLLEVPQVLHRHGRWWMIASATQSWHSQQRRERMAGVPEHGGIVVYVADRVTGPYRPARDAFLLGDPIGTYYTARVLEHEDGDVLIASRFWDDDGRFLGALSDPAPVSWDEDGPTVDPADLGGV
jgi:beta-fructofuranosidase